jgi:CO dehydrogenase/acetyl-CoA synthase alpha subunit
MSNEIQLSVFDYSQLEPQVAVEVRASAERIKLRLRRTTEDIVEIGRELIAQKERLGHGNFLPWIASEFEMTRRTATSFMSVAENLGDKWETISHFSPTILYSLAAAPDEIRDRVVDQAIEAAQNGESVKVKDVEEWEAKCKRLEQEKKELEEGLTDSINEAKAISAAETKEQLEQQYKAVLDNAKARQVSGLKHQSIVPANLRERGRGLVT